MNGPDGTVQHHTHVRTKRSMYKCAKPRSTQPPFAPILNFSFFVEHIPPKGAIAQASLEFHILLLLLSCKAFLLLVRVAWVSVGGWMESKQRMGEKELCVVGGMGWLGFGGRDAPQGTDVGEAAEATEAAAHSARHP